MCACVHVGMCECVRGLFFLCISPQYFLRPNDYNRLPRDIVFFFLSNSRNFTLRCILLLSLAICHICLLYVVLGTSCPLS